MHALHRSQETLAREAEKATLRNRYASLSLREREVMALVVCGLLNKQIGGVLGISEITVKAHRGRMMRKMVAGSVAELVSMALRLQLAPGLNDLARPAAGSRWLPRFERRSRPSAARSGGAPAGAFA